MAGYPDHNFPAFHSVSKHLRLLGHTVYNPAELEPESYRSITPEEAIKHHNGSYRNALKQELKWICDEAQAIYHLIGWEHSKGANSEHFTGRAVGTQFFYQSYISVIG
jgi:hypothetical protein